MTTWSATITVATSVLPETAATVASEGVVVTAFVVVAPTNTVVSLIALTATTWAAAVAENTAETTPESAAFVAVAPATVKKFAATPVNV